MFMKTWIKADGRVMVDIHTFNRMNPSYTEFGSSAHDNATQQQLQMLVASQQRITGDYTSYTTSMPSDSQKSIVESQLFMTWPYLAGFSFSAKRWGELLVDSLSKIHFDDKAYERLVMADDKKMLIRALVEDNKRLQEENKRLQDHPNDTSSTGGQVSADVITGKGGGVIFLLHGSPGVGKTLTAEAIAELLHYPLYR